MAIRPDHRLALPTATPPEDVTRQLRTDLDQLGAELRRVVQRLDELEGTSCLTVNRCAIFDRPAGGGWLRSRSFFDQWERRVSDDSCVFCAIVQGEAEASVVYNDHEVLAFMVLQPVTPGHLLVVPKVHAVGLEDLDERIGARTWQIAHRLGRALRRSSLRCEGVNLFLADGEAAFQEVFHVHLHVFPRFVGDSFRIDANWQAWARADLDAAASAVRDGAAALTAEQAGGQW